MNKSLIALAALSAATLGTISAAEAKTDIVIGVGVPGLYLGGGGGYYGHHRARPVHYYEPDCGWETVKRVKWKHGHKVVKFKKEWVCY